MMCITVLNVNPVKLYGVYILDCFDTLQLHQSQCFRDLWKVLLWSDEQDAMFDKAEVYSDERWTNTDFEWMLVKCH